MPVRRKQQLQAKIESSEGVEPTFASSDAVQVYEPAMNDDPDVQKRTPSGPTLSRGLSTIGRRNRTLTFQTEFRGSGDTSIPITPPDWGQFVRSAGYKVSALKACTVGAVTGTGFQVGEQVTQAGGISGVVVGAFTSGGALTNRLTSTGGVLVVVPLGTSTFTAAATTGSSSGSTSTLSGVTDYAGYAVQTTSRKLANVLTGAWTGGTPAAVYECLNVEDATTGVVLGAVQVVADNSAGSFTDMSVTLLWGSIANGNKLRNAAGAGTATLSAAPVQTETPSIAFRRNLDGRRKSLLGSRCDFTLEAEVGQPGKFSWTFSGDPGTDIDAAPVVTSGLSTIVPPRLLGAFCCYGKGAEIYRLPTKKVALNNGGQVAPNLDANRAGGSTGSNVTDRDPNIVVTTDQLHGAFDWEAARDNGTMVRVAFLLGTTPGNICGVIAPVCQVTQVTEGDSEGIGTFDVTLEPKAIAESGDDDLYLVQL